MNPSSCNQIRIKKHDHKAVRRAGRVTHPLRAVDNFVKNKTNESMETKVLTSVLERALEETRGGSGRHASRQEEDVKGTRA